MRLTGVSPESGWTGLSVHTTVTNPSTRPGLRLPGRVTLAAGGDDVPVRHIRLGLVVQAEPDDPARGPRLVQYHQVAIAGRFVVPAGRRRAVDFALPLPWEAPVTIFGGVPLMGLRTGLRTEVAVGPDPEVGQGAMVPVFVHPLPVQQHVLAALDSLGFVLRQAALQQRRLPGVEQALPVHQRLGYWVAPLYAGPITELEVIFVANPAGLEVLLWADRRLALAGATHQSISRFRVWHAGAERQDWPAVVDGWLRSTINRHAEMAAHADWSAQVTESAHVSRHPDGPGPAGYGLGGMTGEGAGPGGGGAGDGT
ncbi:sporulation protein SpoOM [Micromonospora rosaria]|uniref:Sporulation protein SpoOM n=1 Tax=Micromonospora rosaria TaxID=47874 RepID=A0A136PRC8_9ACTN|nr:sporulation protein [Micromonospora rosaria]KXK60991.1 sporulation protein SpoOM [Micromonospora rosaria]